MKRHLVNDRVFMDHFQISHEAEEQEMAPDSGECTSEMDCFVKIGPGRMAELYDEFLEGAPLWARIASVSHEDQGDET